ncbi:MAG: hypothetical protein WCG87_08275 [Bacteroidota bacterium]
MINKKCLLLSGLCMLLAASPVFAQESAGADNKWSGRDMTYRGKSYDVLDSAFIPKSRMPQHHKFLNHQYDFPARPKDMWEIGLGFGQYNVLGEVPSLMLWQKGGYGFHLQARKAIGYTFSLRMQYVYGIAKGLDWQGSYNYGYNPAWNAFYTAATPYGGAADKVFYNYRMESHQLNLDMIVSTHNINFHRAKSNLSVYGFVGIGAIAYKTRINALDDKYKPYDFTTMLAGLPETYSNKKAIRKKLQSAMDGSYDTPADAYNSRSQIFDNKTLDFAPSLGLGAQYKINKHFNVQVEERMSFPWKDDLLDGQRWSNVTPGSPTLVGGSDVTNYFSIGVNYNLGSDKKNVEPLYWLNPLDYMYNEMGRPRHMILPDPVLPDADGDGVTDQFDKCPGTPADQQPVDGKGCPMDTDGDGVPDYRDKQLITPTECQPVDADGVGKCPCPEGCGTANNESNKCGTIGAGSVSFNANSARVGAATQQQLATLAAQMQANPTCKVVIIGAGNSSKAQQQRSWDRVNAVIEYMSDKHGIDRNRFIFQYGKDGDANNVMFRSANAGEEGPSTTAPPFPNLRKGDEKEPAPAESDKKEPEKEKK